jgi:hypothetical protein
VGQHLLGRLCGCDDVVEVLPARAAGGGPAHILKC